SILSIQVVARAAERGLRVSSRQLFQQQTIAELGRVVERASAPAERESGGGRVPLTPIQRWHFATFEKPGQFSQSMSLRVSAGLGVEQVRGARERLVRAHEQLRARFWREDGEWVQEVVTEAPPVELVEASELDRERDLAKDPMLRAALVVTGGSENRLLLDIHHLVVDGVSWRVLVSDLEQLLSGREELPAATTSYKRWAELLEERARSLPAQEQAWPEAGKLPLDREGENRAASGAVGAVERGEEEARGLLQRLRGAH